MLLDHHLQVIIFCYSCSPGTRHTDNSRSPAPDIAVPPRDKLFATYRGQIAVLKIFDFFYNTRFS